MVAPVRSLLRWPAESQLAARRNALLALTALTELRLERDEVDRVVEAAVRRHAARTRRAGPPAPSSTRTRSADVI